MRYITVSKYGIHFITKDYEINAHWDDFFGIGIDRNIPNHIQKSMKRFWKSFRGGIRLIIKGAV